MCRHRFLCVFLAVGGLNLTDPAVSFAQRAATSSQPRATRPSNAEILLLRSLQSNPLTAPYSYTTEIRGKQIALKGRVGTKEVHDAAIQTAIGLGLPVIDDLVIDTAAAHQVAAMPGPGGNTGYSGYSGSSGYGSLPYTYPPPILGRLDDPFFGFEPPAIAYPPWWGSMTARRLGLQAYPMPPSAAANTSPLVNDPAMSAPPGSAEPQAAALPYGTIDMAIDPRGIATLRGNVPSFAERITLGQRVAQTPGVTQVVNLLNVQAAPPTDQPPPPPTPPGAPTSAAPRAIVPSEGPPIAVDSDPLSQRTSRAVSSRPSLSGLPIRVKVRDGVASLSGKVPTVYEAMLAYRAVQQTPGVREVEDRLEFVVPDGSTPNPLVEKGRPEDVESYLSAQIRRQIGDLAHIDRVRLQGETLEIRGILGREEDRDRFDAILRSIPILRGFRLMAEISVEIR